MQYFQILSAFLLYNSIRSSTDEICDSQKEIIGRTFQKQNPISKFAFTNDSKTSVQVTWAGDNSGKIVIVTTKEIHFLVTFAELSDVYFSDDNGKTFKNITKSLPAENVIIRRENGLQRNSIDHYNIFLVCYSTMERSLLLITQDGGETWKKVDMDFILDQEIQFHPFNKLWLLTVNRKGDLYKSIDGGFTWTRIMQNVQQYQWSTSAMFPEDIFAKVGKINTLNIFQKIFGLAPQKSILKLMKSTDNGKTWKVIKKNIYSFLLRDKFLYVSELVGSDRRRLSVSIDNGKTFNKVYLPMIMNNQFYSIMNIEDDLVYIHVDNNDTRGDGTLFTSDSDGRVFSQSLRNHFYPSIEITSDFYKVKSMRGTYIVSQLNADRSIRSLITFNRGAEWKQIKKPENEPCHNKEKSECYLQVTGKLSLRNNIKSSLPLSSESALGIVLVHGHLASSLKTSRSDVYISSDGGYNWIKALNGPHEYVIADHGGLLVALGENKKFIKFSTDEGRCWHEHQFTTDDIHITGLLTEPGNKAMTVLIWGYNVSNSEWVIHVVDLSQLLDRECSSADYEEWYAHSEMTHSLGNNYSGCFLGKKESFWRLKKDSLCKNGYSHKNEKKEEICPCTVDDFECEYGYYREFNSTSCIRNILIKQDICVKGFIDEIITQGYKKIPSDVCVGGFSPDKTQQKMLNQTCTDDGDFIKTEKSKGLNNENKNQVNQKTVNTKSLKQHPNSSFNIMAVSICSGLLLLFILLVGFILISRRRIIRQKTSNLQYKVLAGLSRQNPADDDAPLITNEVGYESVGQTKYISVKSKSGCDDSDVDLIG